MSLLSRVYGLLNDNKGVFYTQIPMFGISEYDVTGWVRKLNVEGITAKNYKANILMIRKNPDSPSELPVNL
jgi:hypothetical protein